jgi:hypothetical protein
MDEMKSGQNQMGMLLSVNALTYAPPIDGSLVNNRQYKEYNFQPLSYANLSGSPQMIVNSGSDYIYGPTSYIRMNVKSSLNTTSFASSAYDLFREFEIDHRSGDLIDRTRNVNALVQTLLEYQEGKGYADGYAQVFGKGATGAQLNSAGGVDVILPLSWFSGVFSQRALIPASLIAGAKIKLQWEKVAQAVVDSGTPVITISDMSLVLDSFELMDSARKALLQQQANVKTQGLQFSYSSWDNTNRSFDTTGFDLDVNLSAAKTMIVLAKTRLTDDFKQANDSMSAEEYPYEGGDWRLRLGSETQPQHQVKTSAEAYVLTQNAFQNIHCDDVNVRKNAHVLKDFTAYKTNSVIAVNMERSQILSHSGRACNNSRLINLNGTFKNSDSRQMDVWVQILKVANVMVDNVVVDK